MSVLTITSLFPSRIYPLKGIFVKHRVAAMARLLGEPARVVAPVPFFPRVAGFGRWSMIASHPGEEELDGLRIWHPRYLMLPKAGMALYGPSMYWGSRGLVRRLHAANRFDVIDAHFAYPDGLAAVLHGEALGLPVVLTVRGNDVNYCSQVLTVRPLLSFALRRAAAVVAVSTSLGQRAVALGADPERTFVVKNGVDCETFQYRPRAEARLVLGLGENERVILSVGHLIPRKGFDVAIRALSEPGMEGIRYVIVGEGTHRRELENLASSVGTADRVVFLGSLDQRRLAFWYAAADVACVPSRREGTPNVLLEALACGTPVVASRADGIPEALHHSGDGLLCDTEDVNGLRDALKAALEDVWDRESIARRNAGRGWEIAAAEALEIAESVVRRDRASFAFHGVTGSEGMP